MFANTPFPTVDTAIIRSSRPLLFCKKDVLTNFAKPKIPKKTPKRRFRHRCEFSEISHKIFFKEPFGRLLRHKHSYCLLSHHDLLHFEKRCHTYFLAEYFFGLICRLGTRVNSILQALSQKPVFKPVEHLRWSFSCEYS